MISYNIIPHCIWISSIGLLPINRCIQWQPSNFPWTGRQPLVFLPSGVTIVSSPATSHIFFQRGAWIAIHQSFCFSFSFYQQYTLYVYNNLKKSHKVQNLLQRAQWSVVPIDFNDVFFHVRAILQTQTLMLLYTTKNPMIVDCLSHLNLHCKSFIHIPTSEQKSFVNAAYSSDDVSLRSELYVVLSATFMSANAVAKNM